MKEIPSTIEDLVQLPGVDENSECRLISWVWCATNRSWIHMLIEFLNV